MSYPLSNRLITRLAVGLLTLDVSNYTLSKAADDDAVGILVNRGFYSDVIDVVFALDGESVITGHKDGSISSWKKGTDEILSTFAAHRGSITSIAMTPNGLASIVY